MKKCPSCGEEAHYSKKRNCWVCLECGQTFGEDEKPADQTDEALLSTKTTAPIKIFISYAHAQSDVVKDIVRGLGKEGRGHDVWFDQMKIHHGDDWRREITDGVLKSKSVVSFLSREAIREKGVCLDELGIAVGVKYGNLRTVLLQKEEVLRPIPSQLTHRQWLDMSDWQAKKAEGEAAYAAWFRKKLAEIIRIVESDESREFAGEISFIRQTLEISDTAVSRQGWYLRQPYVGRQWLADQIDQWLNDPRGGHLCAVYGEPGTGKSAFAAQYAYRGMNVAASLFFEHGNPDFNSPDAIVRELIFQLACRLPSYRSLLIYTLQSQPKGKVLNTQEMFEQLLANPLQHAMNGEIETQCVVIDGLDECTPEGRQTAARLLSEERFPSWLRVLVCCRPENDVTAQLKPDRVIDLTADAEASARDIREYYEKRLLERLAGRRDRDRILDALTEKTKGVFLYAYIVTDMILHNKLTLDDPDAYPQNLNASFEGWFSRYFPDKQEFDLFYRLPLGVIAACGEAVPLEELETADGYYDAAARCFRLREKREGERREGMMKRLEKCALLLRYEKNVFGKITASFTHRYIAEWLTAVNGAAGQTASKTYSCASSDAFWALAYAWRKRLQAKQPLTEYQALHLLAAMEEAGETEETIRETAANEAWEDKLNKSLEQYDRAGNWKLCLPFAEADVQRCRRAFGAEHPDTLTALNNLAYTYSHLGRLQEALTLKEQVYEVSKRVLGPEHPDTLSALNNLASTYSDLGHHQEALAMEEQVYEARKRVLGPEHPDTLTSLKGVSYELYALGQYEKCIPLDELALRITEKLYGAHSKEMATALNNLSMSYSKLEQYGKALPLMERAYNLRWDILGEDDPATIKLRDRVSLFREKMKH